jgi:hypothetical protein
MNPQPLKVPKQHQPEVPSWGQTRPTHPRSVKLSAQILDKPVEPMGVANLIQSLVEGMTGTLRKVTRRDPHRVLASLPLLSHCHASKPTLRTILKRSASRLSPRAPKPRDRGIAENGPCLDHEERPHLRRPASGRPGNGPGVAAAVAERTLVGVDRSKRGRRETSGLNSP